MTHDTPKSPRRPRKLGPLAIAALLASGLSQPLLPAFAAGTDAGETISNTATATYSDTPGGTPINTTSNTVTVTVAEVAGLTVTNAGFDDADDGALEAGDDLSFDFDITNVGNETTDIRIPSYASIVASTQNFDLDANPNVAVQVDIGSGFQPIGDFTGGLIPDVDPDTTIRVRISGRPAAGTPASAPVGVTLGDTGPNDNSPSTQNQPDTGDGDPSTGNTNTADVRTVDADNTVSPVNGEREASASNSIPFASSVRTLALATVTKENTNLEPNGPTAQDDVITYELGVSVSNTSPNAAFTPGDLEGTTIQVDRGTGANPETKILVSDAIPDRTDLINTTSNPITAPTNWEIVYTTTPTNTPATAATWQTTAPVNLNDVTRIGFIYTNGTDDRITRTSADNPATPFRFSVRTNTDMPATGGQVANIAQVFGETVGDPSNEIVYDESGDNNPNNFNDNGTPPDPTGTNYNPNPGGDTGVANPVTQGTDTNNNNTGTGPGGEANVVNIGSAAGSDDILNGPEGVPGATGPNDDDDDFTNQTTPVPAGVGPNDTFNPDAVIFTSTVQNPASTGFIANVTLEPIAPSAAQNADESLLTGQYGDDTGNPDDIPNGTVVTIGYDPTPLSPNSGDELSAEYTWDSATNTFDLTSGNTPVNIGDLNAGTTADYTVTVDLPAGTSPNEEIPIPIIAFPDNSPTTNPGFTGETTNNITIERLYTGFMRLRKEAQILDENGVIVRSFTDNQTTLNGTEVRPGYQIEYRITYDNISTPTSGTGNVTLTAFGFEIVEASNPATTNPAAGNTWAAFTDHEQNTSADQGTVEYFSDFGGTTALPSSDPAPGTRVERYVNDVGQVDPGQTGQFQFRRRVQ
ncbi:hypothetical protein [Acaryochloris sp. IP29b_bin.137]|uniref:DUF7925 domain-containing protein n=1 Tax=Acaryochloris sp. IP29b_bin.137 TaxID=2969217 RepID=UPI00260B3370|nr:hypothetical protein [Acaryochloris sp. IP29b_bin.137]